MPPSPESLWQQLVEEAGEDAIAEAAAMSVSAAERELTEAGFDVPRERRAALARMAALEQGRA
jgi:hypothetical protein